MKITTLLAIACAAVGSLQADDDAAVIYYIQKQTKAIERQTRIIQGENPEEPTQGRRPNSYDQKRKAADPWGPNGEFANQPKLSEEEILKTQGNTAYAQWAKIRK